MINCFVYHALSDREPENPYSDFAEGEVVMPANAGIHDFARATGNLHAEGKSWMPAFAGMTPVGRLDFQILHRTIKKLQLV